MAGRMTPHECPPPRSWEKGQQNIETFGFGAEWRTGATKLSLDTNSKSINDKNQQKLHGRSISLSLALDGAACGPLACTLTQMMASAMSLHEAFIVCLFLSFVHGLHRKHPAQDHAIETERGLVYGRPAHRIRFVLSLPLADVYAATGCAANFRKLTKLFSLLGFCRVDSNADIRALSFFTRPHCHCHFYPHPESMLSIVRGMSLHLRVGNIRCIPSIRICICEWVPV